MLKDHKEAMQRKTASLLEIESGKLVQEKNRRMAVENLDYRRRLNEKTDELKEVLFTEVSQKLSDYMKTPDYEECLKKQITEALAFARGDKMTIYINPSDEEKKRALEKATGATLTVSATDFIGGTRAVISERNILIDRSFLTKIEEEKDSFAL
jgi:vacuolar-type H+-ATPase subunit E/Vma4